MAHVVRAGVLALPDVAELVDQRVPVALRRRVEVVRQVDDPHRRHRHGLVAEPVAHPRDERALEDLDVVERHASPCRRSSRRSSPRRGACGRLAEDLEDHCDRDVESTDAGLDHAHQHVQQPLADVLQRLDHLLLQVTGGLDERRLHDVADRLAELPQRLGEVVERVLRVPDRVGHELSDRDARGKQLRRDLLHGLERPRDGPADQVGDRGSGLEQALDDRPQPVDRIRCHPREHVADRVLQPLRRLAEQLERGVACGGGPPEHLGERDPGGLDRLHDAPRRRRRSSPPPTRGSRRRSSSRTGSPAPLRGRAGRRRRRPGRAPSRGCRRPGRAP